MSVFEVSQEQVGQVIEILAAKNQLISCLEFLSLFELDYKMLCGGSDLPKEILLIFDQIQKISSNEVYEGIKKKKKSAISKIKMLGKLGKNKSKLEQTFID